MFTEESYENALMSLFEKCGYVAFGLHCSFGLRKYACDDFEHGGFAWSIGSDDADGSAFFNFKAYTAQCIEGAVILSAA